MKTLVWAAALKACFTHVRFTIILTEIPSSSKANFFFKPSKLSVHELGKVQDTILGVYSKHKGRSSHLQGNLHSSTILEQGKVGLMRKMATIDRAILRYCL